MWQNKWESRKQHLKRYLGMGLAMLLVLAAVNAQDVMCSAKEIDPGNEVLWENIGQAEKSLLLEALKWDVVRLMDEEERKQFTIESYVQYALMHKSDGGFCW